MLGFWNSPFNASTRISRMLAAWLRSFMTRQVDHTETGASNVD